MSFYKNGVVSFSNIDETAAYMKVKSLPDGSVWGRINWLDVANNEGYFANSAEVDACFDKNNRFSAMGIVDSFKRHSLLPKGYTRLEYIQSSSGQYIDTGYAWQSEEIEIFLDGYIITCPGGQSLFGTEEYYDSGSSRYFGGIPHGGNGSYSIYLGTGSQGNVSISHNTRFTLNIKTTASKNVKVKVNNNALTLNQTYSGTVQTKPNAYTTSTTSTNVGNMFLFANHNSNKGSSNDATQNVTSMRAYGFRMHDNGALVRDFVPCKNTSNVVGMFDLVERKFYTTPTGSFTAGSIIDDSAGNFEFMLTYPKISATMYNRWRQTNSPNIAYNSGAGSAFEAIKLDFNESGVAPGALTLSSSSDTGSTKYCATKSGWWGPIGQYTAHQGGIPAVGTGDTIQQETELWVRLDYLLTKETGSVAIHDSFLTIDSFLYGGNTEARIVKNQGLECAECIEI